MEFKLKRFDELTGTEVYDILELRNEVFVVEQECIYQDCDDRDKKGYHLFLEENNQIIAYLRILDRGVSYDEISIGRVLIKENSRKKGLARKMMLEAINFVENNLKEDSIRISAQKYLVTFYQSLGFKTTSQVYLEDNIPHQEMVIKL